MTKKNATRQRPPDEINARCQARRRLNGRPGWTSQALPPTDGTRNTSPTSKYEPHQQIRAPPANTSPTSKYEPHQQIQTPTANTYTASKQYGHPIRISPTDDSSDRRQDEPHQQKIQTPPAQSQHPGSPLPAQPSQVSAIRPRDSIAWSDCNLKAHKPARIAFLTGGMSMDSAAIRPATSEIR